MSYYNPYECGTPQNVISVAPRGDIPITRDVSVQPRSIFAADRHRIVYEAPRYQGTSDAVLGFRPYNTRNDNYNNY